MNALEGETKHLTIYISFPLNDSQFYHDSWKSFLFCSPLITPISTTSQDLAPFLQMCFTKYADGGKTLDQINTRQQRII